MVTMALALRSLQAIHQQPGTDPIKRHQPPRDKLGFLDQWQVSDGGVFPWILKQCIVACGNVLPRIETPCTPPVHALGMPTCSILLVLTDDYLRSTIHDSIQEPNRIRTLFSYLPSAINHPFQNKPTSIHQHGQLDVRMFLAQREQLTHIYLELRNPAHHPTNVQRVFNHFWWKKQLEVQGRTTKELIADSGRYDFPIFMSRYDFL